MSDAIPFSRTVRMSLGAAHVVIGFALAVFINYFIRDFPLLMPRKWFDSYWMPLTVACLIYAAEGLWAQLPDNWLYGLLITVPPYGWHATAATVLYFENRSSVVVSEYLRIVVPAVVFALSGAILNPVISRIAYNIRRRIDGGLITKAGDHL